jgi:transposase
VRFALLLAREPCCFSVPMTVKHGSFVGVVRPMIEMDDVLAHALVPLLDARVVLYQHFLELDRRVKRAA